MTISSHTISSASMKRAIQRVKRPTTVGLPFPKKCLQAVSSPEYNKQLNDHFKHHFGFYARHRPTTYDWLKNLFEL